MSTAFLSILLAFAGPQPPDPSAGAPRTIALERCLVAVFDKVDVPARAAGEIIDLEAVEGMQVEKAARLGGIDDAEAQAVVEIRTADLSKAQEQVKNDVNIRYARKASEVAKADYDAAVDANRKVPGAVQLTEMRSRELLWQKALLEIEQAQVETLLAKRDVESRSAQLRQATLDVERREIRSPLAGVIAEVHKHVGEWANAGDKLFQVLGLERLRVDGFVKAAEHDASAVAGRPVTVTVTLAGGRQEQFQGKITFVDPTIQAGGIYKVWAEVANRQEKQHWLLRPGHQVRMEIELAAETDGAPE